nr:cyclin H [Cryptococcus depauperatus CBS 7841]
MPDQTNSPKTEALTSQLTLAPGLSPFHESSQFKHWRFSLAALETLRSELNSKSVEVAKRNTELEKKAQKSLGHDIPDPPPSTTYLTVADELLLLRFYCLQVSKICRQGFGLSEAVESTAISYVKRFYLKNSVMEWHPKIIMPTCLFLAAKTTNFPIPVDVFVSKIPKLSADDVLEKEFLVAQSLGFEFWVRGPHEPLRGWGLELQDQSDPPTEMILKALPIALNHLSISYLTDAELIFTPSQISLACWRMADKMLVESFLEQRYQYPLYGLTRSRLLEILDQIQEMISSTEGDIDLKKVKEIDKRLRQCTNPEKIPGTALYIRRKQEKETAEKADKVAKSLRAQASAMENDVFFGGTIPADSKNEAQETDVAQS